MLGGCQLTAEESQLFAGLIRDQFQSKGHPLIPVCDLGGRGELVVHFNSPPARREKTACDTSLLQQVRQINWF